MVDRLVYVVVTGSDDDGPGNAIFDKVAQKFIVTSEGPFDPADGIKKIDIKRGDMDIKGGLWDWHHLLTYMQMRFAQ